MIPREALLESSGASNSRGAGGGGPRETEQTAELDTQGLLMLQQQVRAWANNMQEHHP